MFPWKCDESCDVPVFLNAMHKEFFFGLNFGVVFMWKYGGFDSIHFKFIVLKSRKIFTTLLNGFHMVLTRSPAKIESMAILEEIRN